MAVLKAAEAISLTEYLSRFVKQSSNAFYCLRNLFMGGYLLGKTKHVVIISAQCTCTTAT